MQVFGTLRGVFITRMCEWLLGAVMLMWGFVLLLPSLAFERPAFSAIRTLMSEETLAYVCLLVGVARLTVLGFNGMFWPLYHLRALLSIVFMMFWFFITLGFVASGDVGQWLASYPLFVFAEGINALRAAADAGRNDRRVFGDQKIIHLGARKKVNAR